MSVETHRTHCCAIHGCKYCDNDCPVETFVIKQEGPCETCDDYGMSMYFKKDAPIILASQFVETSLRAKIGEMLDMLPPKQRETFQKCIAPGFTLETTPEDKLRGLYDLCVRSVHAYFAPRVENDKA